MNTAIKKLIEGMEELNASLEQFNSRLGKLEKNFENGVEVGEPDSAEVKTPKEEKVEMVEVTTPKYDQEKLEAMKYNELKALCKDEDLKASGKKDELISRLLEIGEVEKVPASEVEEVEDIEEIEVIEETPEIEEETEEAEEENESMTLYDKVEKAVEGYSNEELADVLDDIGKSPKGKRQALLAKLVLAVEEGELELDLEGEEETEETEGTTEAPEKEEIEEPEDEEVDINDYVDGLLENSTKKRKEEATNIFNNIVEQYNEGNLTDKEIRKTLDGIYDNPKTEEGQELISYIALMVNLVDDEGEHHDLEEPYELEGKNACCGEPLKDLENGNLYCEVCGQEYEVE